MTHSMRVCAFGSFDRSFDRSWILLEALEQSGAEITYCHFDLWAEHRHKTKLFPWRWLLLAGRYLAGAISIGRRFLQSPRCDVLYVGYMGHVDLLIAAVLNRRRRSTLVFDPCISLYNTLVEDRQLVKAGGIVAKLIRRLDVVPCGLADVVLSDTSSHGEYFQTALGVPRGKLHRVFVGAGEAWQRARWSPPVDGPFRVLFYAKFSPLHGITAILDAAEQLKHERVHFTIVGGGQLEDALRQAVERSGSSHVEWIPWLEREALIDRMRACHVSLGIFGNTAKAAMVIPNKVFQALAMGVPVITRDSPAIRELLDDGTSAVLCETDGAALASAILASRDDFGRLQAIGQRGREVFVEHASHHALAQQFLEAIDVR
jgi:glycosyltransferase involved in cell wall biosynthesis